MSRKKDNRKKKEHIKKAMNKRVFFNLTRCSKKLKGLTNRYCYKSNMHNLIFKDARFQNVKYQSSIITNCNFNQATLIGVDFCNCNLRKTTFKKTNLKNVCFINCKIEGVDFLNAEFDNVIFVCTGVDKAINIPISESYKDYRSYPSINMSDKNYSKLLQIGQDPRIYEPHVLHVNKKKLNYWTLGILCDIYGEDTFRALCAIEMKHNKRGFYTIYSYMKHIEKYLKL